MSAFRLLAAVLCSATADVVGTCGRTTTSRVQDCDHPDFGFCVTACCKLAFIVQEAPSEASRLLNASFAHGGPDSAYTLQRLAKGILGFTRRIQQGTLRFIGQARHMVSGVKHFNDTMDILVAPHTDGSLITVFSKSEVGGVLNDFGQNYKNIVMAMKGVPWGRHFEMMHLDGSCSPSDTIRPSAATQGTGKMSPRI